MGEIRTTIYSKELQKQLFPDNSFYKKSIGESGIADTAEMVEKPVQAKISKAKEGEPSSLPLQIETSTDSKKSYKTTLIYCQPLLVDSQSELLVNYNKRQSKQMQQADELNTKVAAYTVEHWAPSKAENILKTTGYKRASNIAGFSSQRKAVTKADLLKIQNLMMRMMVGMGGEWYGMVTADMYTDLLNIPEFVDYYKTGNESALKQGIIGRILGISIFVRSTEEGHSGLLYKDGTTPLAGDSAITDALYSGGLFWHSRMVCRAEGQVRTVVNTDAPGYLGGTILESFMRYGADIVRDDQKGVIALLEDK